MLPLAWCALAVVLITQGRIESWRGWLALAGGLVLLLGVWNSAHEARVKRLQADDQHRDVLNAPSA